MPIIIVESELDAILIQQEAAHLVCCIALEGVSKKPDAEMHEWLQRASLVLLSLDFDSAGKKRYSFWMGLYPNLRPWPAPLLRVSEMLLGIFYQYIGLDTGWFVSNLNFVLSSALLLNYFVCLINIL